MPRVVEILPGRRVALATDHHRLTFDRDAGTLRLEDRRGIAASQR